MLILLAWRRWPISGGELENMDEPGETPGSSLLLIAYRGMLNCQATFVRVSYKVANG